MRNKALTAMWGGELLALKQITIHGVLFKKGDWVCVRPNEDDVTVLQNAPAGLPKYGVPMQMWFAEDLTVAHMMCSCRLLLSGRGLSILMTDSLLPRACCQ